MMCTPFSSIQSMCAFSAPSSTASPPSTNGVQIGTHIPLNMLISGSSFGQLGRLVDVTQQCSGGDSPSLQILTEASEFSLLFHGQAAHGRAHRPYRDDRKLTAERDVLTLMTPLN